jgi:hypothetical protein
MRRAMIAVFLLLLLAFAVHECAAQTRSPQAGTAEARGR